MPPCIDSCTSLHALRSAMSSVCSGGKADGPPAQVHRTSHRKSQRQVELRKLGEGSQTHQQGVPEYQVQSLQLAPCGWCCPFFLLFFLLPTIHCDLLTGLDGSLPFFRKGTDDVLGVNETNLAFAENLYWRRKRASLPWSRYCGFGMPHLAENSFSSWGRSHRTSVKESGLEGPGPGVANTDGCVWIISLAALTTWNSFIAAKPELAAVKPL